MKTITYQQESYENILESVADLSVSLSAEVDRYDDEPTLALDHDQFIQMDAAGILQCVVVKDDNEVVGFHISIVQNDIFFKYVKTGYVLFYYLLPEYRGEGRGTHMFKYAENAFRTRGVTRVFMSRKIYIPNEKMFATLGYEQIEANYTKLL